MIRYHRTQPTTALLEGLGFWGLGAFGFCNFSDYTLVILLVFRSLKRNFERVKKKYTITKVNYTTVAHRDNLAPFYFEKSPR